MINTNSRAEVVLDHYKDNGVKISAAVSDAIVNYELPQYGVLHAEALYLLDTVTNGLADWRGPGGSRLTPESPADAAVKAVRRAVSWLRNNHIQDPSVLKMIMRHFEASYAGVPVTDLNQDAQKQINDYVEKLQTSGIPVTGSNLYLGCIASNILNVWGEVWDHTDTYDILTGVVYQEKLRIPFEPFEALSIMRMLEQTYIAEQIKE